MRIKVLGGLEFGPMCVKQCENLFMESMQKHTSYHDQSMYEKGGEECVVPYM